MLISSSLLTSTINCSQLHAINNGIAAFRIQVGSVRRFIDHFTWSLILHFHGYRKGMKIFLCLNNPHMKLPSCLCAKPTPCIDDHQSPFIQARMQKVGFKRRYCKGFSMSKTKKILFVLIFLSFLYRKNSLFTTL